MIEDLGPLRLGDLRRRQPLSRLCILLDRLGLGVVGVGLAAREDGVVGHGFPCLLGKLRHLFLEIIPFFAGRGLKGPVHLGGELLVEKRLNLRPLEAKEAVEAEIQVGRVELKQLAKKVFQSVQAFIMLHCCPRLTFWC